MRNLLFIILAASCVTTERRTGRFGPVPLIDEMPQGRVQCRALCSSYGRDFSEYTYEGACICKPDPKAAKPLVNGDV